MIKGVVCEPDQAFREIGRRRGVGVVRERCPALRLPERLDLWVILAGWGGLYAVGTGVAMAPYDVHDVFVVRKQFYIRVHRGPGGGSWG